MSRILFFFALSPLAAQTQPVYASFVTGSGYTAPPSISIAPGQITTFFVGGLSQAASDLSALTANFALSAASPAAITILSAKSSDASTLAITVQIPFSLSSVITGALPLPTSTTIQFCEQTNCTAAVSLQITPAIPHLISTCDIFYSTAATNCQLAIYHQNGQFVTNTSPAAPGEILTLWALGLGAPSTAYSPTATTPVVMNDIVLQTEFDATPTTQPQLADTPYLFAGLPNPAVGLYQINFTVPPPPADLGACIVPVNPTGVASPAGNLSLSVGRKVSEPFFGFDTGAFYFESICVSGT